MVLWSVVDSGIVYAVLWVSDHGGTLTGYHTTYVGRAAEPWCPRSPIKYN